MPSAIGPVLRRKAQVAFRHGASGHVMRDNLRWSDHTLGSREIARRVAVENRLDASDPSFDRLVAKVRARLWRYRKGPVGRSNWTALLCGALRQATDSAPITRILLVLQIRSSTAG